MICDMKRREREHKEFLTKHDRECHLIAQLNEAKVEILKRGALIHEAREAALLFLKSSVDFFPTEVEAKIARHVAQWPWLEQPKVISLNEWPNEQTRPKPEEFICDKS